jgi:hypothetical protein
LLDDTRVVMPKFNLDNLEQFFDDVQHQLPPEFPPELWAGVVAPTAASLAASIVAADERTAKVHGLVKLRIYLHEEVGPGLQKFRAYLESLDKEKMTPEALAGYNDAQLHMTLTATLLVSYSSFLHGAAWIMRGGE